MRADPEDARKIARAHLHQNPDDPQNWFSLARALLDQGARSEAQAVMIQAVDRGFDGWSPESFDLIQLGLSALGEYSARIAEMTKPCPVLGRADTDLDPAAEAIITCLLDQHLADFEVNRPPAPSPLDDYVYVTPSNPLRILTLFGIPRPGEQITDIPDGYENSARALGHDVRRLMVTNDLIYDLSRERSGETLNAALAAFDLELARFRPDLVVMDGNFIGHHGTIRPEHFAERQAWDYRLMVVIPDVYDTQPNFFDYWAREADLVVYLNRKTTHIATSQWSSRGLYWPGVPLAPDTFAPFAPDHKDADICLLGTLNRGREVFQTYFEGAGLTGHYRLHNRTDHVLATDDYRRLTARSRMVINTGVISANHRIVTLRVFESVLAQAVLLDESGSEINQLFQPFVHYLPFSNVHQAIKLAQYMIRHEDRRRAMARRASEWYHRYFAGDRFWAASFGALGYRG